MLNDDSIVLYYFCLETIVMSSSPKTRHDWYQTESHVVITILAKNAQDTKINYGETTVSILNFNLRRKFQHMNLIRVFFH